MSDSAINKDENQLCEVKLPIQIINDVRGELGNLFFALKHAGCDISLILDQCTKTNQHQHVPNRLIETADIVTERYTKGWVICVKNRHGKPPTKSEMDVQPSDSHSQTDPTIAHISLQIGLSSELHNYLKEHLKQ